MSCVCCRLLSISSSSDDDDILRSDFRKKRNRSVFKHLTWNNCNIHQLNWPTIVGCCWFRAVQTEANPDKILWRDVGSDGCCPVNFWYPQSMRAEWWRKNWFHIASRKGFSSGQLIWNLNASTWMNVVIGLCLCYKLYHIYHIAVLSYFNVLMLMIDVINAGLSRPVTSPRRQALGCICLRWSHSTSVVMSTVYFFVLTDLSFLNTFW